MISRYLIASTHLYLFIYYFCCIYLFISKGVISDRALLKISEYIRIDQQQPLVTYLNLKQSVLTSARQEKCGVVNVTFKILHTWRNSSTDCEEDQIEELADALILIKRYDIIHRFGLPKNQVMITHIYI